MATSAPGFQLALSCLIFRLLLAVSPTAETELRSRFATEYASTFNGVCPLARISCESAPGGSWGNATLCSCDEACAASGTCCWDAPYRAEERVTGPAYLWKCVRYEDVGIYMIASCPSSWPDADISTSCQQRLPADDGRLVADPLSAIPVSAAATGATYRNYYCAHCHGDADGLVFWMFGVNRDDRLKNVTERFLTEHLRYDRRSRHWLLTLPTISERPLKCNFSLEPPQDDGLNVSLRRCRPPATFDACPATWTDGSVETWCHWYAGPVHSTSNGTLYRNAHCALCNGERPSSLTCSVLPASLHESPNMTTTDQVPTPSSNVVWKRFAIFVMLACLVTSLVGMAIHLVAFALVPSLRNLPGKMLTSLCLALSATYVALIVAAFSPGGRSLSSLVSLVAFMCYFFLVSFFWMNSMAFDVWRAFRLATQKVRASVGPQWKKFALYSAYSWGSPVLLVVGAVLMETLTVAPPGARSSSPVCSRLNCTALLVFVVVPVFILMVANVVFAVLGARIILRSTLRNAVTKSGSSFRYNFKLCYRLSLFMGVTWILGFVAEYCDLQWLHYVFAILNALQGFFLFLTFTCRKKVYRGIWDNVRGRKKVRVANQQSLMPDVVGSVGSTDV